MELEHVGIAVRDAETAIERLESLLGVRPYKSETVETEGVRTHFLRAGGAKLELLEALNEHSPIARHLEKRGPGLHHLAFEVSDLDAVQDRLTRAGFSILGPARPGADGKRVFFVHPRDTGGVLFEFCGQIRSILTDSTVSVGGRPHPVRRAGTHGPVALIAGEISIDVELLARRLEQSAQVVVARELPATLEGFESDDLHVIAPSALLSRHAGIHLGSLTVVVNEPGAVTLVDRPTLVAAKPSDALAATALFERWPNADLAVGDDDLLIRAIEKHIRRRGKS